MSADEVQLGFDFAACAAVMPLQMPPPRARRTDPATSHEAAAAARELVMRHRAAIVACLQAHGPLGKDGIAARTRLTGVAVARRMCTLQADGLVRLTGKNVLSTAGCNEREWEAVA